MALPIFTQPPIVPNRSMGQEEFVIAVDEFLEWIVEFAEEAGEWALLLPAEIIGINYNGSSTSSLTVGTGSKTLTIQTGKLLQIGQFVTIANTATPANYMTGQVTAYNSTSGSLTVLVDDTGGSGTFTAWTISLGVIGGGFTIGGTLTGLLVAMASAAGGAGFRLQHGSDPSAPVNGDLWTKTTGLFARINGSTKQFSTLDGIETLSGKTLVDPVITGTILEDPYGIVDGAAFEIDPGNGSLQTITLGANRTPKGTNFANGESITLLVTDGTAYTITWTDATFGGTGVKWLGGTAPTLSATGITWIILTKFNGQVYGSAVGVTE